jgi:hypothetical protein
MSIDDAVDVQRQQRETHPVKSRLSMMNPLVSRATQGHQIVATE